MEKVIISLLLFAVSAQAQDISDVIQQPFKEKKSRKMISGTQNPETQIPAVPQFEIPKKWPETDREKCNKNVNNMLPVEITTKKVKCAKNMDEVKTLFPVQHKSLEGMRGFYSDNLPGDYEERVSRFQEQDPDNYKKNDQVPIQVVTHSFRLAGDKNEIKIQLEDFDEKAKVSRTEVMPAQLCHGIDGFFFQTADKRIPVRFQGKKCLWVAMNGIWTAQRKGNGDAPEFPEPDLRASEVPAPVPAVKPAGTK